MLEAICSSSNCTNRKLPLLIIASTLPRSATEINRAYCAALGDTSQLPWDQAPEWQRQSAINGEVTVPY